jgi:AcrR family transcriptional regulator
MPEQPGARRSVGRPPGPAPDPAARRAELLEAATRVIRTQGAAASMDELAAEAGVTKPILYGHFGDRAGLASALAERFVNQVAGKLAAAFGAGGTPESQLRQSLDAFVGFVEEDPHVYQFIVREAVNAASTGKASSIARLRVFDALGTLITAGLSVQLRQAGRDPERAEPVAFATMGMVFGAAEWWLDRRTISRAELVAILGDLLWTGLAGTSSAGG